MNNKGFGLQLSVASAAKSTTAVVAPGAAVTVTLAGQVITGAGPSTNTDCQHCATLPLASAAVQETVWRPGVNWAAHH